MEADWEVEIGPEAPVIEALWSEFVDLRATPERLSEIAEGNQLPALSSALTALNAAESPFWTTKCDVWTPDSIDPDEMAASLEESAATQACYIDLLPRGTLVFPDLAIAERWAHATVDVLRRLPGFCCRVDLILRQALVGEIEGFGVTAYLSGCGTDGVNANIALSSALIAFTKVLCSGENATITLRASSSIG